MKIYDMHPFGDGEQPYMVDIDLVTFIKARHAVFSLLITLGVSFYLSELIKCHITPSHSSTSTPLPTLAILGRSMSQLSEGGKLDVLFKNTVILHTAVFHTRFH